ncbi:MAG: hypothetical protein J6T60_05465 [Bacteroidales bacterium]|nr:hypothetical protein [Bacteroidales bacterium]
MTSKQFFKYLVEPEQLNDSSVVEMEQLIKQFPFFQTAHLLYLKALSRINPKLVKEKLPKESLFVSDRSVLHSLLRPASSDDNADKKPVSRPAAAATAPSAPKPEDKKVEEPKKAEEPKKVEEPKKAEEPKQEEKKVTVTTTVTEVKTEKTAPVVEVKETKEVKEIKEPREPRIPRERPEKPVVKPKTESEDGGAKKALSNEERKQNHDNLVKDFFDLKDQEKYETVATNVAEDGSIQSAAAELAAKSQIDRGTVINDRTATPQTTTTTTTVVTTVIEKTTKPAETAASEPVKVEQPAPEPVKAEPSKDGNKDEILDKIAMLRKEREEARKKRMQAEEEAKKTKAAAEEEAAKVKAEAEAAAAKAKAEAEAAAKAKAEAEAAKVKAEEAAAKAKAEAEAAKAKAEAEAAKAKAEAEAAAKTKAEAEAAAKAKAEAEAAKSVTTTVTTTTVTETVTTTVEPAEPAKVVEEPKAVEEPKPVEPAKPADEEAGMSAADKLLARLNKYKKAEPEPVKTEPNLIDKFLQEDHHLDRNKEVTQGDMGQDSVKQPELYSEKLAKLYIQQGHYDKAIASYEKLNLKYPERSAYFAVQIEEVKNLMKNNQ